MFQYANFDKYKKKEDAILDVEIERKRAVKLCAIEVFGWKEGYVGPI